MKQIRFPKNLNRFKPVALSLLVLLATAFIYKFFHLKFNETVTLLGIVFALVQTLLSFSAIHDGRITSVRSQFDKDFVELKRISDHKDLSHDQEINELKRELFALHTLLDNHTHQVGHQTSIQEIMRIKDEVAVMKAAIAVLTKQGEIELKLRKLQEEIAVLSEK